jgi:hypothetical protein
MGMMGYNISLAVSVNKLIKDKIQTVPTDVFKIGWMENIHYKYK